MSAPELVDSTVLVVGGTSGSGLASAVRFAREGVTRLVLVGRNAERGAAACTAVEDAVMVPELQVGFLPCDANDPAQAVATTERARELLGGRIDVLVNATAAAYTPSLLKDLPIEDIARVLTSQALAPMHFCRAALPVMSAQGSGVMLNCASDAAKVPTPGETVLGASMAAIVTFSRTLAMEAKRNGIRVNAITPSLIEGTIVGELVMQDGFSKKLFEKARTMAHLGVAEPDDLAALIVFLAGPGAARITGQAISVNGGISAA